MWETWVQSLGAEDPLEKEIATHSSTLAWKIPWMEEPGGLQSTGSQRVGPDWATSLHYEYKIEVALLPNLNTNLLSFSINTVFQSQPTVQFQNQCHIFSIFTMRATKSVPVFDYCITNYHKIMYPKQLFYVFRIWQFRIWMTSTGQLVFLIHLLSAGVTKVECPLTSRLTYLAHMFSVSALLGHAPCGVSFSRSSSQGFDFSQHGALRVAILLPGGWLLWMSVPKDRKQEPSVS